jgi:hypothetical protein
MLFGPSTATASLIAEYYTLPPDVPYRGYQLKELTLVPGPVNRPVECWRPIVSATPQRWISVKRHQGAVAGAATMAEGPWRLRDAAARPAELRTQENLAVGIARPSCQTASIHPGDDAVLRGTSRCSRRWASCPASRLSR